MSYESGSMVLYGSQGVCRIDKIVERDINGASTLYYVLKPAYDNTSTIYIPVNNEATSARLRQILSVQEVHELIHATTGEAENWIGDDKARREKYRSIIYDGDRKELVELIKTLYLRQQEQSTVGKGRKLSAIDERFMKDAEKLLYEEFGYVLNIKPEQVVSFIAEQISAKN